MAKAQLLIHHQQRQQRTSFHTHAHPKLIAEFNRNGGEFIIVINKEQEEIQLTPAHSSWCQFQFTSVILLIPRNHKSSLVGGGK